jgi:hypothetical protein
MFPFPSLIGGATKARIKQSLKKKFTFKGFWRGTVEPNPAARDQAIVFG